MHQVSVAGWLDQHSRNQAVIWGIKPGLVQVKWVNPAKPGDATITLIARFMGPTWGLPGADRTQVGPMWATWTLLSGLYASINLIIIGSGYALWLLIAKTMPQLWPVNNGPLGAHFGRILIKFTIIFIWKMADIYSGLNILTAVLILPISIPRAQPLRSHKTQTG